MAGKESLVRVGEPTAAEPEHVAGPDQALGAETVDRPCVPSPLLAGHEVEDGGSGGHGELLGDPR